MITCHFIQAFWNFPLLESFQVLLLLSRDFPWPARLRSTGIRLGWRHTNMILIVVVLYVDGEVEKITSKDAFL